MLIKTDRLTERQNQGNLMTQSHGSKVTIIVTRIARLPKSKIAGMTISSSLLKLRGNLLLRGVA
jgi:hypothetical protein